MESPKYYLEPYQVFILKKLLLQSSADKETDKGILKIYSNKDYQYYEDTGGIKILRYLFRLSENKIFSIIEPMVSSIFGDASLRLADNLTTWIAKERIEKAQAILNKINTTKDHVVTMEEFGFFSKYIVTNEPPGELALVYCLNEGNEVFSRDVRLHFEVGFNEKGTEILRKYLDDYAAAFMNGELSRKKENYFSYQTSTDIFKEKFGRLKNSMGTDALHIQEELFYGDKTDYREQIRFWETLIAMEKEGDLKIIYMDSKIPSSSHSPKIGVQLKEESQLEDESGKKEQHDRMNTQKIFPTPSGTGWNNIHIEFISEEEVIIRIGKEQQVKKFWEMGFVDKRKSGYYPDFSWILLGDLATFNGEITGGEEEKPGKVGGPTYQGKKMFSQLRKKLQDYFHIKDDPFEPYKKTHSYKTKFWIIKRESLEEGDDVFEESSSRFENLPNVKKAKFYEDNPLLETEPSEE
ncbi:MAG: hypothetical protein WC081_00440 [Candidatus Ratteibacteria bacterium]|jgi:hypothetical protein